MYDIVIISYIETINNLIYVVLVEEDIMFEGSDFEDETLEDVFGEGIGEEISLEEEGEIKTFLKELRGTENT